MPNAVMTLFPSLLYGTVQFLELARAHDIPVSGLHGQLRNVAGAQVDAVLAFCSAAGLHTLQGERIIPSTAGEHVLEVVGSEARLRALLRHYILAARPPWARLIPTGRRELLGILGRGARQCFAEAGLSTDDPPEDVVSWWDDMAAEFRPDVSKRSLEIGRLGERLSIGWEHNRTGHRPIWTAVETNLAGYDLLSRVSTGNSAPITIEVKASEFKLEDARAIITRNEWRVAEGSNNYVFHLWCLGEPRQLAVVPAQDMAKHVPIEQGSGVWEAVVVPMAAFAGHFTMA